MHSLLYFILGMAFCNCVKVDMEGTISLGKDIVQTISRFLGETNLPVNSRRSLIPLNEDKITEMIKVSMLCRDLELCENDRKFMDEYVTVQAKGMENILSALLGENYNDNIYDTQLKYNLAYIRAILLEENEKLTDNNESDVWINVMKKISAKFQEMAIKCVSVHLDTDEKDINVKLNQKLILATVIIEMKYIHKLCAEKNICGKTYECSYGLNTIMRHLLTIREDKLRSFIKYFYESLYDTSFYTQLRDTTAHGFQVILNDMAYSKEVPVVEILSVFQKLVAARVEFVTNGKDEKLSHDGLLIHVILSDMDNLYRNKSNPFGEFLNYFFEWITREEIYDFSKFMRRVLNDIVRELSIISNDLLNKLANEVRVFLEITVDSD